VIRSTSYLDLVPAAPAGDVDQLIEALRGSVGEIGALAVEVAPAIPFSRPVGDLMVLAAFAEESALENARRSPYATKVLQPLLDQLVARTETTRYHQGPVRIREPELTEGVQRTLLVRVDPATDPGRVAAFERDIADMHRYIDAIRNSSLSRVDEVVNPRGPVWTHVWEQEFATLDGLTGPYMAHAYHWAYVDTWFDPQAPNRIVDRPLVHSACGLRASILGRFDAVRAS